MSARFPDPDTSRAVLFGSATFPGLPWLPAAPRNLDALRHTLADTATGVFGRCVRVPDSASAAETGAALHAAASAATDVLLVYYTGFGVLDDRGRLCLAVADSSAVVMAHVRDELAASPAAVRVLILDARLPARAIDQTDVDGTYVLTTTATTVRALGPPGEAHTAFTAALLSALDRPLTLDEIHARIDTDLTGRDLPRPRRRPCGAAADLVLSRGPAGPAPCQPLEEPVRYSTGNPPWERWGAILGTLTLFLVFLVAWYFARHWLRADHVLPAVIIGLTSAFMVTLTVVDPLRVLTIDHVGITFQRDKATLVRLAWYDIAYIGVVSNGERRFLVARPSIDVTVRRSGRAFRQLARLGYVPVCSLSDLEIEDDRLSRVIPLFGGAHVYRDHAALVDADPRLVRFTTSAH